MALTSLTPTFRRLVVVQFEWLDRNNEPHDDESRGSFILVDWQRLRRSMMIDGAPAANRRVRWWLVATLSIMFGVCSLVAAFLTVNASMDAVSNEHGELRVTVFGIRLHQERGPWQPLEKKMFTYGWT